MHRDCSKQMSADALSRVPAGSVNNVQDDAMGDLRVPQQADSDVLQLRGWIELGKKLLASTVKGEGHELHKLYVQFS